MDVRSSFWSSLIFGIAFGSTWPSRTRSANKPWSQESWHFANSRWTRFCVISELIWKTLRAYRRRSKARKMRTSAVLVLTSAVWLLTWASGPKRKSFLRNAKYVWRSNRICRSDGARQDPIGRNIDGCLPGPGKADTSWQRKMPIAEFWFRQLGECMFSLSFTMPQFNCQVMFGWKHHT